MASVSHRGVFDAGDPGVGPEGPPGPQGPPGASDFGIVVPAGSGVDDTTLVQQALDAVPESGVLRLWPGSTYAVGELTVETAGISIEGSGATLVVTSAVPVNGAALRVLADNITISDLVADSGGLGNRYFIRANVNDPAPTPVRNLTIRNVRGIADHRQARGIYIGYYDGVTVQNCRLSNTLVEADPGTDANTIGIVLHAGDSQVSRDARIVHNRITGFYNGIESFGTGLRQGSLIDRNTVRETTNVGIYNYHAPQAQVTRNHVEDCFAGIYADSSTVGDITVFGNQVAGNTVRGCDTYGIITEEHQSASVTGNTCVENRDGLVLGGGTGGTTITGNTCSNNTRYGIWADKDQTPVTDHLFDLVLVGNTCRLNGEDGIRVGGVKRSCTIEGNLCTDNGTSGPDVANPYAGVRIGFADDSVTTAGTTTVRGGALGNDINSLAGTGGVGRQGYGILCDAGVSTALLRVHGVYFEGHGVSNIDTNSNPLEEWGNYYADGTNDFGASTRAAFSPSGQLLLADGLAATPGLAFVNDPDTGLRRSAANTVQHVVGGTDAVQVNLGGLQSSLSLVVNDRLRITPESIKTVDYGIGNVDTVVIMDGTSLTATLPASPGTNQVVFIRNQNAGSSLTVARNAQNINGAASDLTVAASTSVRLIHVTGSGWYAI